MTQTLLGILIGLFTSFVAGVVLIWKGDQFVRHLRKLPTKRRVSLYTKAYLRALRSYPYRYLHFLGLNIALSIVFLTFLAYALFTYLAFTAQAGRSPEGMRNFFHYISSAGILPWISGSVAVFFGLVLTPSFFKTFSIEVLIPYAHRELQRLRECVAKCATPEQFVAYTDAEHSARIVEHLRALVSQAKMIIHHPCALADEILDGITDETEPTLATTSHVPTKS